jgi:hypothetical protein
MKKVIVTVKDTVAEIFNDCRVEINAASAIRAFSQGVKDSPHKDDYSLYIIGEMDMDTGVITPCEPMRIHSGHDVKKQIDAVTPDGMLDPETPVKAGGTK